MAGSVLIIDADPLFAAQAQASFEGIGLQVAVRDDASLDLVRKLRPSVLVVNVELPKGSGFSVCNRLRRDKELNLIPILLTSSATDGEAFRRHATTAERADDYATKPIDQQDLVARVRRLVAVADERKLPVGALEGGDPGGQPSIAPPAIPGASSQMGPPPMSIAPPPIPGRAGGPPPIPGRPGAPPPIPGATTSAGAPPGHGAPAMPGAPGQPVLGTPVPGGPLPFAGATSHPTTSSRDLGPPMGDLALPGPPPAVADEVAWRPTTFDEMLRERLNAPAPAALPKLASGEQREAFLRGYGKYLEAKEKAAREGWEVTQEAAKDLDRRHQHARFELGQRDQRIAELSHELNNTRIQLSSVQTELKAFQAEITRIFQDKDAEERETHQRLSELEETNSALSRDLQESRKQNDDDKTRLKLFRSELDDFQAESDRLNAALQAANDRAARGEDNHRAAERAIQALEGKIAADEALIAEKEASLEEAREALTQALAEADAERARLVEERQGALEARESELQQQIAGLEATELELRNEVESLSAERSTLESELARRTEEKTHLERVKAELTSALDDAETHATEQQSRLAQDIAELEQEKAGQAAVIAELSDARDELDRRLRETQDELLKEQATWTTREAELNAEVDDREQELITLEREQAEAKRREEALVDEVAALKAALATAESAGRERTTHHESQLGDLEEELEEVRSNLFERMAELDAQRSNNGNLAQQLEAGRGELETEKARAAAIDAALRKVEAALDDKRRELAELSQRLMDAEAARTAAEESERSLQAELDDTNKKLERADNFVIRAKEKIVELQKRHDDATADVRREAEAQAVREREARREVEEQLNHVEDELSRRELEAAEATRRAMELEQQLSELTRKHALALSAKDTELADRAHEIEDLRKQAFEAQGQVESQEGRILALIGDVETRERTSQGLRSELSHKEQKLSTLGLDLVKARDQLRANAELSRERERRDALLGRLMTTLETAQSVLATSPASVGRRSVPPGEMDTMGALGHATADIPTRQLTASWPGGTGPGGNPAADHPDLVAADARERGLGPSSAGADGASPMSGGSIPAPDLSDPRDTSPAMARPNPTAAPARAPARTSAIPAPRAIGAGPDDETTSEGVLGGALPSLRAPFPPSTPPPPLVPNAPTKPDALTPAGTSAGLFGALINEIQSEGAAQRASATKAARRVSIEPPRAENPRASKRRARVPQAGAAAASAADKPRTGGTLNQLDEVAMLVDASLMDPSPPKVDPFRTAGADLPAAQSVDILLEDLDRADAASEEEAEDVDEGQVTEIIRLDQLK